MSKSVLRNLEMLDTKARKLRIKGGGSNVEATINITPLVDVVLVLLIIFMVVTPMLNEGIELPKSVDPKKVSAAAQDLKINIKLDGEIQVGDKVIAKDKVLEAITKELSKNPFRPVYLSADKGLQFSSIRDVLTALRDAGVSEAGLMSSFDQEGT